MERTTLSFDGHGINDCDEYGSRIATLTTNYKESKFGPLFAAAPDMLEALTEMVGWFDSSPFRALMTKQGYQAECHRIINTSRAAIAKAQGK